MTENHVIRLFLRLLRRERQIYQEKPKIRESLAEKIAKYMKKEEKT